MSTSKIVSVKHVGKIPTIDIEVAHPTHLFYANGVATSNSHSYSYAENAFISAYLKAHFPVLMYCAYLNDAKHKMDPMAEIAELVSDAKSNNVTICTPSLKHFSIPTSIIDNCVYFGASSIKGIGAASCLKLEKLAIKNDFKNMNWYSYLLNINTQIATSVTKALISAGALDYMGVSRTRMNYELEVFDKLSDKEAEWITNSATSYKTLQEAFAGCSVLGCKNKPRKEIVAGLAKSLANPPHSLTDSAEYVAWTEEQVLGTPISCNKVDGCERAMEATHTCKEAADLPRGYAVLAVEINAVREIATKKGKTPGRKMAFVEGGDSSCSLNNLTIFPEAWTKYRNLLYEGNTVLLQCNKDKKTGGLIIEKVQQI